MQAQTFQNDNSSCEESALPTGYWISVPYMFNQVVCGRFNDDKNLGAENFPDCVLLRDMEAYGKDFIVPGSLSFLQNRGKHGGSCLNEGGGPQFFDSSTLFNTGFTSDLPRDFLLGSLSVGNLDNDPQGFLDIAWLNAGTNTNDQIQPQFTPDSVQYLFSEASGGFAGPDFKPNNAFFEDPAFYTGFPSYFAGAYNFKLSGNPQLSANKSMVLMDCNEDGLDDAVLLAREGKYDPGPDQDLNIMVSVNNNGVLQSVSTNSNLTVLENGIGVFEQNNQKAGYPFGANLVSGDFDGDGHNDLIVVSNHMTLQNNAALENFAVLCRGNGACGFDCSTNDDSNIKSLQFLNDPSVASHATVSGDFDGNGKLDLVVADTRNSKIYYFFNKGNALKDWAVTALDFPGMDNIYNPPVYMAKGRFSTLAVQKGIDEIVASFTQFKEGVDDYGGIIPGLVIPWPDKLKAKEKKKNLPTLNDKFVEKGVEPQKKELVYAYREIRFLATDGQGGILPYEPMSLGLSGYYQPTGIGSADFDRCGGDDVVGLAWQPVIEGISAISRAHLFLNENEAPELKLLTASNAGLVGQSLPFTADCSDPTFDDRSFTWKVIKSPVGSKPNFDKSSGTLIGKDNTAIAASFTGDMPGDYEIELTCQDFCGLSLTQNFKILLSEEVSPTTGTNTTGGDSTSTGTSTSGGTGSVSAVSQGGCIANLNGASESRLSLSVFPYFLLSLLCLGLKRYRMKVISICKK